MPPLPLGRGCTSLGGKAAFGDWEGEWALLAASGIDGVFVDHADLGVRFFGADADDGEDRRLG